MKFENAPSLKRVNTKEKGPEEIRIREFEIPINSFVGGNREALESLRNKVQRDSEGRIRKNDRAALEIAFGRIQKDLSRSYENVAGKQADSSVDEKALKEKTDRLATIREQFEISFAA